MNLTNAGKNVLLKAQMGSTLKFKRVGVGSGTLAEDVDIRTLTALIDEKMQVDISSYDLDEEKNIMTMKVNISNKALETGFFMREIGIFVEDPENADNEILYSVMNAGDEGDFLPRFGNIPVEIILEIFAVVGEAEHIEVVINDTLIYVLRDEFNRKFDEIQNRVIINDMEIVRLSEKTNDLNNQLTTSDEDARRLIMELQLKLKILEKNNIGFYDVFKTLEDVDQEQTTAEYSIENQNYTFDNTGNEKVTMKRQLYTAFDKIILEAHVSKVNQLISDGAFDNVETIKVFSGKNIIAGDKVLINGNVYSIVNVEAV
jgi:hypothetical protein